MGTSKVTHDTADQLVTTMIDEAFRPAKMARRAGGLGAEGLRQESQKQGRGCDNDCTQMRLSDKQAPFLWVW